MFERLFEDLRLQRLLAEQSMQLSNLALQGPVIRRRNDLLAAAGRRQGALSDETTPGEELVGSNPVPTCYQAHGGAGFICRKPRRSDSAMSASSSARPIPRRCASGATYTEFSTLQR